MEGNMIENKIRAISQLVNHQLIAILGPGNSCHAGWMSVVQTG
jgi:hypothetical protein